MPPITFQDLPLNIYMVIFGTGVFIFVLSLIFCCYFIRLVPNRNPVAMAFLASPLQSMHLELTRHDSGPLHWLEGIRGFSFVWMSWNMAAMPDRPGEPAKSLAMLDRPGSQPGWEASRSKAAMLDGLGSQPSKLRHQAQSERFGYKEVVLKGDAKKLNLHGVSKPTDESKECLVKWLEVRCVCPMCNKPIRGPSEPHQNIGILLDELV
ncbi:RING finger protein [Ophiophagus hannah]|uniref:RING finger protein n=1 Tax=Ophiophagus hannah TaxID=8665 RepID=V8NMQ2_OPHHA|nr:RING finger protein [Ophiophagus hannah]